ncbi:reprolysin-like metallopeptidase [Mesonia sp. HuA40]|uniref:reprolysin-like metallopeptidase n=1 Tax=Mesonia sp. HuA40 TaxID=2602761 RepID=UPI0011CB9297|nr:hypothetical protein [Mesonia sp. HuA40]TXK72103.1 hypothetical protein FT993_08370 [Mesonia sp. HuA40]
MLIAHEIGHNFNLRHPFDNHEGEGDLKLQQGQTLENIMGYLPDAEKTYKSFITYQWEKMRTYLHTNKNNAKELNFETYHVPRNWRSLKDFSNRDISSNLSKFCQNSLEGILGNRMLDYNDTPTLYAEISSIFENDKFQDNIIGYFIESIIRQINQLCD